MATEVRLVAPHVRVVRDGTEPLEIQTDNRDLVAWESTRIRHKWPKFDEAPFKWLTFISWSAARRQGMVNGVTYEAWESSVLSVTDTRADDMAEDELGRPTQEVPETD
jgi:hypothetical protein